MRKFVFTSFDEVVNSVEPTFMEQLRSHTLVLVQKENISTQLRKKICDIIGEISKNYIGKNDYILIQIN